MDKLDKLLNDHHEAFDEEPLEGHLQRFEGKLDHYHSRRRLKDKTWPFLKIASLVIIVLLSANLVIHLIPAKSENKIQTAANNEMDETARFYTIRINSGFSQLKQLADQGIGSEQELVQVKKEMDEMDQLHQDLQKEYSKNPNDERVINAMIDYYQTKLNIINTIKSDLENVKSIKNKNNEKTAL
jgi:hypothetical protein